MQQEDALDADAIGDATHGKALVQQAFLMANDHAFKELNALAIAFLDLQVYAERITGAELGAARLYLFLLQFPNQIDIDFLHRFVFPLRGRPSSPSADVQP